MRKFEFFSPREILIVAFSATIFFYLRVMMKLRARKRAFSYGAKRKNDVFE